MSHALNKYFVCSLKRFGRFSVSTGFV